MAPQLLSLTDDDEARFQPPLCSEEDRAQTGAAARECVHHVGRKAHRPCKEAGQEKRESYLRPGAARCGGRAGGRAGTRNHRIFAQDLAATPPESVKVLFATSAWLDYLVWQNDDKGRARVNRLIEIEAVRRQPFIGEGKPEPLKGPLKGSWSRRINEVDRLVYNVTGSAAQQQLEIIRVSGHYAD